MGRTARSQPPPEGRTGIACVAEHRRHPAFRSAGWPVPHLRDQGSLATVPRTAESCNVSSLCRAIREDEQVCGAVLPGLLTSGHADPSVQHVDGGLARVTVVERRGGMAA
jgi:hypothetical protein